MIPVEKLNTPPQAATENRGICREQLVLIAWKNNFEIFFAIVTCPVREITIVLERLKPSFIVFTNNSGFFIEVGRRDSKGGKAEKKILRHIMEWNRSEPN